MLSLARVLFVSPVEVDRPVDGLRWRAALTYRALSRLGPVEVVEVTNDRSRVDATATSDTEVVLAPRTPMRRLLSRAHPRLPKRVAARDWRPARKALADQGPADLVWVMQPDLVGAGVPLPAGPLVVDLVDLEDGKYDTARRGDRLEHDRWAALQEQVCRRADAVVLAHPGEAARVQHARAVAVPNAVDVAPVAGRLDGPPTVAMVGRFTYQPNLDAAWWFASEVLPLLRQQDPSIQLRLVGRHDGLLNGLVGQPGVEVTGFVADLGTEWRQADVMVAPIRVGTGTRVKIIEAFARGVAVASTTLGCDGLDVTDGIELRIGDSPDELATACLDLLGEPAARSALIERAHTYVEAEHSPVVVERAVADAVGAAIEVSA